MQTSLAKADHYSHMPTVKILRLGGERLIHPPSKKKKKKKKSFGSLPAPQSVMLLPLWYFWLIYFAHLLIAESPQVTQIYTALHILVLHMHRKFDVDSIDSF